MRAAGRIETMELTEGMSKRPDHSASQSSRDERLRAALRANLARRKAQVRARSATDKQADDNEATDQTEGGNQTATPRQE